MPILIKHTLTYLDLCGILEAMDDSLKERTLSGGDTLRTLGIGSDSIGQVELLELQDKIKKHFGVTIGPKGEEATQKDLKQIRDLTLDEITEEIHRLLEEKGGK